ncbi:YbaN family protein [Pseudomonas sp. R1-18]|uniref:YbaN family protein n=1 Tax=Pseudomonas sp. R1-18 TaxID=1632772 RepID=UPI003DA8BACF
MVRRAHRAITARRQPADRLSWPGSVNLPVVTMTYKPPGSRLSRFLFGILAYVSLGIGIAAIFIPGLPTTEFILLAAWAATRSSPRLNAWLEHHWVFGPILHNWRNGRLVARRAKISATVSMLVCAIVMLGLLDHAWWLYLAIAGMALGNLWIWSRPEPVRELS